MTRPSVSIIMPVYKAETTIRKSLDSILAQTLENWELIIVDDGSPDASGKICNEYVSRDTRITVIHQQNSGVSAARQTGLNAAKGEYIIHVDPDDWVEPQMLEEMYKKAKVDGVDMVISDFYLDSDNNSSYKRQEVGLLQSQEILNEIFKGGIHGSCCNKLISLSSILESGSKFPEGINYCEDICFNVQLLRGNVSIAYINKAYYHYVQHKSSITNKFTRRYYEEGRKYVDFLETLLPQDSFPILRVKEWLKKEVFRNQIMKPSEIDELYPEIRKATDEGFFQTIMYSFAFNGHHFLSKIFLFLYSLKSRRSIL